MAKTIKKVAKKTVKKTVKKPEVIEVVEAKDDKVLDRLAKVAAYDKPKAVELVTILDKIKFLSNKRVKLAGKLQGGTRVPQKEEIAKEIETLNRRIADLKQRKVKEDASGRTSS